jgi:hypothetical protein
VTKLSFFTLALLGGVGCAVVACSSSGDDTAATGGTSSGGSAGKGSGGSAGKGSGGSGASAGKGATGGATSIAGTTGMSAAGAGGDAGTLYDRLGGNSGIKAAVDAIVMAEVGDPDIASYFSQSADPTYSPSVTDIKECLVLQLGKVTGGPEKYPDTVTSGFVCEDMITAHADLGINSGTFDKFVSIAAGVLTSAGVSDADVGVIGGVLNSTKPAIVTASPDSNTERACTAPAACAEAGAGGAG